MTSPLRQLSIISRSGEAEMCPQLKGGSCLGNEEEEEGRGGGGGAGGKGRREAGTGPASSTGTELGQPQGRREALPVLLGGSAGLSPDSTKAGSSAA